MIDANDSQTTIKDIERARKDEDFQRRLKELREREKPLFDRLAR